MANIGRTIELIKQQGVVPLFYHDDAEVCIGVAKALYAAGIRFMEFTNRGENAEANFKYLIEAEVEYPVSINGKMRTTLKVASEAEQQEVEKIVLSNEVVQKWLEGKSPIKIIFVKNRMVNVVV